MKSLLVTLEYPPDKGGVANYCAGIAEHWPGGLRVLHVKLGKWWPRWLSVFFDMKSEIQISSINLLQVGQVLPLGYVALLVKWFYGIPYVVYTHGMDVLVPQSSWHKTWLLKYILLNAKLVVANSEFTKSEVVKLGIGSDKIVVVYPCPVEKSPFHPPLKKGERGGFDTSPIILTVSRLVARKGIDTVLAALPEVMKHVPNVVYVIIGDGPDRARLTKLAAGLTPLVGGVNPVLFLGKISDEEKMKWYNKASVFVLVPRALGGDVEGFGMVYLEANAHSLPVVGSCTGGVSEAVLHKENGLVVEPDNPHETAEALIRLLTNPSLGATLGMQGRARVFKEFQWPQQLQKIITALSRLGY